MADKMLIDASHEEETRVVVVRGNRIEEFDFESQHKKQLRGNIYLAKVTRVEPSLQAAFVEYGGNRHGFLAFSEIHPDYYQIPVADRQALLEADAEEARREDDEDEAEKPVKKKTRTRRSRSKARPSDDGEATTVSATDSAIDAGTDSPDENGGGETPVAADAAESNDGEANTDTPPESIGADIETDEISENVRRRRPADDDDDEDEDGSVESVGAEDALEEVPDRGRKLRKQYRIQEVIKRRQILLVQVVKEERGNKGAALTTYLSLAGRYSVLMPNTARGGGISRKITNAQDRKRLKEVARGLEVPQGMGVILRTAGANRTKTEVKRDFEYLMRLWENVRNLTLTSSAPCLVYEEGSLIKRSIRDLYNKDINEVIVAGEEGYREAKDFMKMLMPSHAKVVQPYREVQPIFARSGIEAQLDKMLQPQVTLKSGGYIIINQTEALVAIDVNSGRSTKEHSIEDTAVRTNLEAADEVARQLRLRDLAGLIVIDFIDMEEKRNNRAVEKRVKDCLKSDRARIQVGRISHFGLLEMSRQRIRASVLESTMQVCDHCGGTGYVRSMSSVALYVLRTAEEHLLKNTTHNITIRTTPAIALYVLNQKRDTIVEYEHRFGVSITVEADASIGQQHLSIDQGTPVETPVVIEHAVQVDTEFEEIDDEPVVFEEEPAPESDEDESNGRKRKRRRRRRGGRGNEENGEAQSNGADSDQTEDSPVAASGETDGQSDDDGENRKKRRRRGKRGGKRNRDQDQVDGAEVSAESSDADATQNQQGNDAEVSENPDGGSVATDASVVAETATVEASASEPSAVEASPEVRAPEAEEAKPARRRRAPRRKVEPVAAEEPVATEGSVAAEETPADVESTSDTPVVEAVAEPDVIADKPAAKPRRSRRSSAEAVTEGPKLTSTKTETDEKAPAEEKPKKAGWWQRGFF
ncbi:MAG: Rne/Rng family ribonuclease [Rhizobiaceae bacterium]|nr:Rne/Rng family ribonuclease [Rhizobiaceae bacterium]